jgi:tetratricopeptide (TPR) repeat protein
VKQREPNPLVRFKAHATQLMVRKRYDLAEPAIRKVLSLAPDDPDANRQLASCLMFRRRLDEALEQIRRAVSLKPDAHASHVIMAAIHSMRSEYEQAIGPAMEALRLKPDYIPAYHALADACTHLVRWPEVLEWTSKGLAVVANHAGLLRCRSHALAAVGRNEEAILALEESMRLEPGNAVSHAAAGSTYWRLGRIDEAADHLSRSLAMDPANPQTHKVMGTVRLRQEKLDEARHHFEQALALHPGMIEAKNGLKRVEAQRHWSKAKYFMEEQRWNLAVEPLRKTLELNPKLPATRGQLARALFLSHRYQEARLEAEADVNARPGSAYAHFLLGLCMCTMEEYEAGMAHGDKAVSLEPGNPIFHSFRPSVLNEREKYQEALEAAEPGLAIDGAHAVLLRNRAVSLAGVGRGEEAKEIIFRGFSDNNEQSTINCIAKIHFLLKEYSEAEVSCRRSLELDPNSPGPHAGLGLIYVELGRYSEAKPFLQEALRINPWIRKAREALEKVAAVEERRSV